MRNRPFNDYFQLAANGGVPRDRVLEVLRNPKLVAVAVKAGRCLLCRHTPIDAAGLCEMCLTFLSDEERNAAQAYYDAAP